jgi:hypothetical protein
MIIEELKIMLGDAASNYTDAQIGLCAKHAIAEVQAYCNRDTLDIELEIVAQRIALIKLNRMNTEGLASQSMSGVSEQYIDGYPADIKAILNRKRRIKVL